MPKEPTSPGDAAALVSEEYAPRGRRLPIVLDGDDWQARLEIQRVP